MQTFPRFFTAIISSLAFFCFSALAANSGVIHFRGQIVEPPCDYQPSPTKMSVNCYQDGKNDVQTLSMKSLLQGQQFVNDKSTATLHWLNTDKNAAILTVQYK